MAIDHQQAKSMLQEFSQGLRLPSGWEIDGIYTDSRHPAHMQIENDDFEDDHYINATLSVTDDGRLELSTLDDDAATPVSTHADVASLLDAFARGKRAQMGGQWKGAYDELVKLRSQTGFKSRRAAHQERLANL